MIIIRKLKIKYNYILKTKIKLAQIRKNYFSCNRDVLPDFVPVISYYNADLEKDIIVKQNKDKSGIYRWTNKLNNKIYIGSSINLSRRFKEYYNYNHISDPKRNFPIHSALLKYGYSNFGLEILEYCNTSNLINREQYYINLLKPEYNILKTAGSVLGLKHSETTKELYRTTRLGVKRSKHLKLSRAGELVRNTGKTRVFSEETRLKLSANNHKSIAVNIRNTETGVVTTFSSQNKAAQFLGVSETTVRRFIKQQRSCKSYIITIE